MSLFYVLLTLVAGACSPIQAGINAQLSSWAGHVAVAAFISFFVGTLALLVYVLALGMPWPQLAAAGQLPWWIWTGGCLGAFLVAISIVAAPKLGAAAMIAVLVAGQMLSSVVLDHFGLVGYDVRPVSSLRVLGSILLVTGVVLIQKH